MGVLTDFFAATTEELATVSVEWGPAPGPIPAPPVAAPKGGGLFGFLRRRQPEPDRLPAQEEPEAVPVAAEVPALPVVQTKGILDTAVGALDTLLTGTAYETLLETEQTGQVVREAGEEGPWIFAIRAQLRDALAALPVGEVERVGRAWATDEEIGAKRGEEVDAIVDLTGELRELAIGARDAGRDLYLWVSL